MLRAAAVFRARRNFGEHGVCSIYYNFESKLSFARARTQSLRACVRVRARKRFNELELLTLAICVLPLTLLLLIGVSYRDI